MENSTKEISAGEKFHNNFRITMENYHNKVVFETRIKTYKEIICLLEKNLQCKVLSSIILSMKYKIISYLLQDGRWGCSFTKPPIVDSQFVTLSEPVELGEYFKTKEEADNNTLNFLKNQGIKEENIEI